MREARDDAARLRHYGNGVILAIIFAGVGPFLWGPRWARALTFMTIQTVFGVWLFMMPLLDMGVAGVQVSAVIPVISLVRHLGFGLVLVWLCPFPEPPVSRPAS